MSVFIINPNDKYMGIVVSYSKAHKLASELNRLKELTDEEKQITLYTTLKTYAQKTLTIDEYNKLPIKERPTTNYH